MPARFSAADPDFLTAQRGWVLGSYPCLKSTCEGLVTTLDGGSTWRSVDVPTEVRDSQLTSSQAIEVKGVAFRTPQDGVLYGTGLWTTTDGGATWAHASTVAGVTSALVLGAATGPTGTYLLLSGTDPNYGDSDNNERLAYAPGGSSTFHVSYGLGLADAVGPVVSGGTAYVLRSALSGSTPVRTLIRVTGASSKVLAVPDMSCDIGLTASTAKDLLLECGEGVAQGSMGGRTLYGSTDGGTTWIRLPDPGAGGGYDGGDIADAGGGNAVIATGSQSEEQLIATSDAGRSWHPVLTFYGMQGLSFSGLAFQDATHGVVIGPSPATTSTNQTVGGTPRQLSRSADAGQTWSPVSIR